jgi:hypothetical protein
MKKSNGAGVLAALLLTATLFLTVLVIGSEADEQTCVANGSSQTIFATITYPEGD